MNSFRLQTATQLAHYLRSLRQSRGLTQRQLGDRLGVTAARISEIERDPSGLGVARLLNLLHVLGASAVLEMNDRSADIDTRTLGRWGEW